MLIAPTGRNNNEIQDLTASGMQIVFVDRKIDGITTSAVLSENEEGAYLATKYLLSKGHSRIGIVLGLSHLSTTTERLRGYKRALKEASVEVDESLVVYGESQVRTAQQACHDLLVGSNRPTAIFATNNLMTIGVMAAVHEAGLRCPQDISVVGLDPYRIGVTAVKLLLANIQRSKSGIETVATPEEVRVPVRLIVRQSVKNLRRR